MATPAQAVTANRLDDGEVVYLDAAGNWAETLEESKFVSDKEEAAALLAVGEQSVEERVVLDPYLFDVTLENGVATPVKKREYIRANGPTVRLDLGKQAEADTVQFKKAS